MTSQRVWARWGLDPRAGLINGVLIESLRGSIVKVEARSKPPADLPEPCCFPTGVLTPGMLNAHAHLDFSWLRGRLPRTGFVEWVGALIAERNALDEASGEQARLACADALRQAVSAGTTSIWDISSLGFARPLFEKSGLASICFAEIIAPTRGVWEAEGRPRLAQLKMASYITTPNGACMLGVAPHSPYTVIPEALEACAHWANRRAAPLAIHLAESPEENEMLIAGAGPLLERIQKISGSDAAGEFGGGVSPIERACRAGALQPHCLAVHCNLPQKGEVQLLARSGAVVAVCPLSHAWFDYPPYPLEEFRQAGARMALGTDSLASNHQLDVRLEAAEVARRYQPEDPLWLLALATGAALGELPPYGGRGVLAEGKPANWAVWEPSSLPRQATVDAMIQCWLDPSTRCVQSSVMSTQAEV